MATKERFWGLYYSDPVSNYCLWYINAQRFCICRKCKFGDTHFTDESVRWFRKSSSWIFCSQERHRVVFQMGNYQFLEIVSDGSKHSQSRETDIIDLFFIHKKLRSKNQENWRNTVSFILPFGICIIRQFGSDYKSENQF